MNREERRKLNKISSSGKINISKYIFHKLFFSNLSDLYKIVSWIEENPKIHNRFDKAVLHKSMSDFNKIKYRINKKQNTNISFYMTYLIVFLYRSYLSDFIKLKSQYEKNFFSSDYSKCLDILNEIEKKFGYSIWGISQKFKVIELRDGLSENKKLLSEFLEQCPDNVFIATLLQFLSNKSELNISYSNYMTSLKKYFRSINDSYLSSYFYFKLNPEYINNIKKEHIPLIFQVDMRNSIIDLYEDFIKLIQFIDKQNIEEYNFIELYSSIQDSRILNSSIYYNQYKKNYLYNYFDNNEFFLMVIDLYTTGNYEKCKIALEFYIKYFPDNFQAKILLSKVYIHLNIKPFNNDITCDLYNIYSYNNYFNEAITNFYKYILIYSDTKWESKILYFINRYGKSSSDIIQKYSFLNDDILTPGFSTILKDKSKNIFLDFIKKYAVQTSKLYNFNSSIYDGLSLDIEEIEKKRYYFYYIRHLIQEEKYDQVLSMLDELISSNIIFDNYYQEKIYRYKLLCYEKNKRYNDYIDLIVSIYMSNRFFLERIKLSSISKKILSIRDDSIKKNELTPIFAYISNDLKKVRKAFSNFIDYNYIENVNDLLNYEFKNKEVEEFFLYNICSVDVMKRDYKFGFSVEEVYNSRLMILKKIISQGMETKKYLDEMMLITSKMKIKEQTKQINNNRIFVDVEGIKKDNSLFLKEDFDKYIFLKEYDSELVGINLNDEEYIDKFKQIYDETNNKSQRDVNYKQNLLLLKSILERITEEFLFNSKYGLDTFLSARIRHGYCKDQLTKVFKTFHLLSKKTEDGAEEYLVNEYWDKEMEEYPNLIQNKIKKELSDFTNQIEMKISEVKDEWIRIKIKSEDNGLFDYIQFSDVYSVVIDREKNIGDFNIFYDSIISYLWCWTNEYLEVIRSKIKKDLYSFFIDSLDTLEKNIEICKNDCPRLISNLKKQINLCRTDIAKLVEEFSNIFYKNDVEYNNFKINDAVFTCEQLFQQLYPSFNKIKFSKNTYCKYEFKGKYFPFFIDVFNILISNCIQHSGINNFENLTITMKMNIINNDERKKIIKSFEDNNLPINETSIILKLSIENNLNNFINCIELDKKITAVFDKINNKETTLSKKYTQSEGGTGLMKLSSILKYNMNTTHLIAYNINKVKKTFMISVYIVIWKGNNENENIIC